MVLNNFDSDDYIYFQMDFDYENYKKGEILRYNIESLRKQVLSDTFSVCSSMDSFFEFVPKKEISKYAIFPFQLYDKAIVKVKCACYDLRLSESDFFILDDYIKKFIFTDKYTFDSNLNFVTLMSDNLNQFAKLKENEIVFAHNTLLVESKEKEDFLLASYFDINNFQEIAKKYRIEKVMKLEHMLPLKVDLEVGTQLDFKNPSIALIFTDQFYMRLFSHTHILNEKEKLEEFQKDFKNCVIDYSGVDYHYFKLKDGIKVRNFLDFECSDLFPEDFNCNLFFNARVSSFDYNRLDNFDYDEEGFLRFVYIKDNKDLETEILKIAYPATMEDTISHFQHEMEAKRLDEEAFSYYWKNKNAYKQMKKQNSDLTYIEFMMKNKEKLMQQKYYMYQRLINSLKIRKNFLSEEEISKRVKKI